MNDLVDGVVRSFGYALSQDEVTVTVEALPPLVADRVQMEAVLGNLVDNAAKYIGDGPERSVVVGCVEGDHGREYFVRDTGVGMTPAQAAKVFQPFRRFHADSVPGEGIGLAHVRKIIERHGGKIRCETTEGVGTTFYFSVGSESGAVADEVPVDLQAAE
jgi:signal transduction histidine kinase